MPDIWKQQAIKQQISATDDFDGTLPTGTPTLNNGVYLYTEQAAGGLFIPVRQAELPWAEVRVVGIEIRFGGQATWTISIVDTDDDEVIRWAGTVEDDFAMGAEDGVILLPNQEFKLETTGAATAMYATVKFSLKS